MRALSYWLSNLKRFEPIERVEATGAATSLMLRRRCLKRPSSGVHSLQFFRDYLCKVPSIALPSDSLRRGMATDNGVHRSLSLVPRNLHGVARLHVALLRPSAISCAASISVLALAV
jgi:hypothetical protein